MADLPRLVRARDPTASGARLVVEAIAAVDCERGNARRAIRGGSALGALDVALLGMGEDAHVSSLFSGFPELGNERVAFIGTSPKPPAQRSTLTRRMLAPARRTILVATGEAKHVAVERLHRDDATLPATGLPNLIVVTDLGLPPRGTR